MDNQPRLADKGNMLSRATIFFVLSCLAACAKPNQLDLDRVDGADVGRGGAPGSVGGGDAPPDDSHKTGGRLGGADGAGVLATGGSTADAPTASDLGESTTFCKAGDTRCGEATPTVEVCTLAGQWVVREACLSTCAGGACAGSCTPGTRHCASSQMVETCSLSGDWEPGEVCPLACTGQGICGGECKPNAFRCGGDGALSPQACDENGKWINAQSPCEFICANGSCAGECKPGAKRCGTANTVESCEGGTWKSGPQCQFVCMDGACAGACTPGKTQCVGTKAQLCNSGGKWVDGGNAECRRGLGSSCSTATECLSDNCVRGICCDSACEGTCMACTGADTGKSDGTCAPIKSGQDPLNQCAKADPSTCRFDGSCDGKGACRYYGNSEVCQPAQCSASTRTGTRYCDGSGSCLPGATKDCGRFGCSDSSSCRSSCPEWTNDNGTACVSCGGATGDLCCLNADGTVADAPRACRNGRHCALASGDRHICVPG